MLVPVGALIGSFCAGVLSKHGRRFGLMLIDMISIIGVLVCLMGLSVTSEVLLLLGRFICGFAVGLHSTVIPLYVKEMTPVSMTG
jgi:MFS family permease